MSVLIKTSRGDIRINLYCKKCELTCRNFLKLCKMKYYNGCLFHTVRKDFTAQTGDPTGTGRGGDSVYGFLYGDRNQYFEDEIHPDLKHSKIGTVAMANSAKNLNGSQFYFTLRDDLECLDGTHTVFGETAEGLDTLMRINGARTDAKNRPYRNIRIMHTDVLEDPFDDPPDLAKMIPDASPQGPPKDEGRIQPRLEDDWDPMDEELGVHELQEVRDIPGAEVKPQHKVLFVCNLNPVTKDADLKTIFTRFGTVVSADVVRDLVDLGCDSCYAFIEFENKVACMQAYFKMNNVLIDDKKIEVLRVDFNQAASELWSLFRQKDSQKGKGNGSTDHVAKDCVGGNQPSKFIVKDQNRQHGGGEGCDMVSEGDVRESPKREKREHSHDKEKIRRRSSHEEKRQRDKAVKYDDDVSREKRQRERDERESWEDEDRGRRHTRDRHDHRSEKREHSHDKEKIRRRSPHEEKRRQHRDDRDSEDTAVKYDGRRQRRERDKRYDDDVSREKRHSERDERESRGDEDRRKRRRGDRDKDYKERRRERDN